MDLKHIIGTFPNFPKEGINFLDVMPILGDPNAFAFVIAEMAQAWQGKVDTIVALDARGFLFGAPLAHMLGIPFVPVRKKGKLPGPTSSTDYELEYGTGTLEIQKGAIKPGAQVLVVDDLLATGGTAAAACALVKECGADVVGCAIVIELHGLGGKEKLADTEVRALVTYDLE